MRDRAPSVPGLLNKAGVKWAFFSDNIATAPELKKAMRKAIDAGLSPADAVRALTLTPAEIYGVSDRLGSIEKGKIANVFVSKGDFFDEKSLIQYVFIDGREFRPTEEIQKPASPRGDESKPPAQVAMSEGDFN
jgi:imidazolonepropionase-like amidohydrolase